MSATRGFSGGLPPFPKPPAMKDVGSISLYVNTLANWSNVVVDTLNKRAKTISYAPAADLPPLAGPPRLIAVPDDPVYGQCLAYNGTGSGTAQGWNRIPIIGTIGGSGVSIPSGGTTSQVLGKHSTADFDMAWQTPEYVPAGGATGQVLSKSGTADYALAWSTPEYIPAGGATGQVLAKTGTADYAVAWTSTASIPTFNGALVYSTATQTLTSGTDARVTWTSTAYNLGTFWVSTAATRLTVGTGISYVQINAGVDFVDGTAGVPGTRHAEIWKNGSAMGTGMGQVSAYSIGTGDTVILNLSSPVLAVGSGDYFELNAGQNSGTAATIPPAGASWFALKVIQ